MRRKILKSLVATVVKHKVPIHVWGACARARGVLETDLAGKNATFANPTVFVGLVQWSDKVLTE